MSGYICCIKRAGPTIHRPQGRLCNPESTTKCIYSTYCTSSDYATFRVGCLEKSTWHGMALLSSRKKKVFMNFNK